MSEIKRCPFCGTSLTNEKPSKIYIHERTGCVMDLRGFTEEQLNQWNTRKLMQEIVKELKEASFPHKIGGETQLIVLKKRIDEIVKEVGEMNEGGKM